MIGEVQRVRWLTAGAIILPFVVCGGGCLAYNSVRYNNLVFNVYMFGASVLLTVLATIARRIFKKNWLVKVTMTFCAAGLSGVITVDLVTTNWQIYSPVSFDQTQFDDAASWVESHPSFVGHTVQLPGKFKPVSVTGCVYVTGEEIFFPCWLGRSYLRPGGLFSYEDNCQGYLYSPSGLKLGLPDGDMDQVIIYGPNFSGLYGVDKLRGTTELGLIVTDQVNPHWWIVESEEDT